MYTEPKRLEFLDSIRGLAALFVLLSHTIGAFAWPDNYRQAVKLPFVSIFSNGTEAVAMFFLLSGFVLSRPYISDPSQSKPTRKIFLPTFYLRRFIRIWPPWFFVFVLSILAQRKFFLPQATNPPTSDWLNAFWHSPLTAGDFFRQCAFLLHDPLRQLVMQDWSLGVELKGSVLVPLFILLSAQKRSLWLLALLAGVFPLVSGTGHYYVIFVLGVLLARYEGWLHGTFSSLSGAVRAGIFTVGLLLYQAISFFVPVAQSGGFYTPFSWLLTGVGCALILVTALTSPFFQQLLLHRAVVLLGRISYSFYLLQFIIILCFLPKVVGVLNHCGMSRPAVIFPLVLVTSILVNTACAWFVYRLVEIPVIGFGHALTKKIHQRLEK